MTETYQTCSWKSLQDLQRWLVKESEIWMIRFCFTIKYINALQHAQHRVKT